MPLLYRPKPLDGESISSYIHRVAKANYVSSHELWRLISPPGVHYPQTSMSSTIDICPINFLDMRKFEDLLMIKYYLAEKLSFIPVFKKMGITYDAIPASRSLSGLISSYRKFCPECLKENNSYKLIWQVKEITFCPEHNAELLSKCTNCNKTIPILPSNSDLGVCPYCNYDLNKCYSNKYIPTDIDNRILYDWSYLLYGSSPSFSKMECISIQQNLAIRVIYICRNLTLSKQDLTALKGIYQIARESKSTKTFLHLKNILYFSRLSNVPLKKFFETEIPYKFIESIFKKPGKLSNNYNCIAPWCKNYLIPGKLKRTTTSKKDILSGATLNYYMYCSCCGTEYAIDSKTKALQERGYFIDLAWNKVRNSLDKNMALRELANIYGTTEDKIKRSIIFLAANSLINENNLKIELPQEHEEQITTKIKELINLGFLCKQIKATLSLTYNTFLYYWFFPEIRLACLNRHTARPDKCVYEKNLSIELESAIKYLINNNIKITVKEICKILNTCPETLRNRNLLDKIQKSKNEQIELIQKNKREWYLDSAEKYINQQNLIGNHVYSDGLYLHLGCKRNVVVRTMPDVTKSITVLLKNQLI